MRRGIETSSGVAWHTGTHVRNLGNWNPKTRKGLKVEKCNKNVRQIGVRAKVNRTKYVTSFKKKSDFFFRLLRSLSWIYTTCTYYVLTAYYCS